MRTQTDICQFVIHERNKNPDTCELLNELEEIMHGVVHGFCLVEQNQDKIKPFKSPNFPESEDIKMAIAEKLNNDIAQNMMKIVPEAQYISPIFGNREKTKIREVKHLSAPKGRSINDFSECRYVELPTMAGSVYPRMKPGSYMAKADVATAYRTVTLHPLQRFLFNFEMYATSDGKVAHKDTGNGTIIIQDCRIQYGARPASAIFCRLMRVMEVALSYKLKSNKFTVVYIDDWFIITPTEELTNEVLEEVITILQTHGFSVKTTKTEKATQDIIMLGIRLETNSENKQKCIASLPSEKIDKAVTLAENILNNHTLPKKQIEKTIGFCVFAAEVVFALNTFIQGYIQLLREANKNKFTYVRDNSTSESGCTVSKKRTKRNEWSKGNNSTTISYKPIHFSRCILVRDRRVQIWNPQ